MLEHIEDIARALRELRRILADGGYLILCAPTENTFYKLMRFVVKVLF